MVQMLSNGFAYVLTSMGLLLSFDKAGAIQLASQPNWVILEGGAQIKGVQLGRYFSENFGVEAGYLNYRPSTWHIENSTSSISIYSMMFRASIGPFRAGIGPAYRTTSGSERCNYITYGSNGHYLLGPPITWEMQTVDVESTIGLLWPISNFRLGFNVITWGKQISERRFILNSEYPIADIVRQRVINELRKDTYTLMTATLGYAF